MGARDPSAAASSLFVLTTSRGRKRARLSNEAADDDSGVSNMPNIFPFGLLNSDKERFVSVLICLLSRFSKFNCCVRREESSLRKLNFEMRKKYHEVEQIEPKAFKKVFVVAKKNEKGFYRGEKRKKKSFFYYYLTFSRTWLMEGTKFSHMSFRAAGRLRAFL